MNVSIPKWITVISIFIAAMGLFVGFSLYLSPGTFIKNIDFSSPDIRYLANMWAARQIAIAVIIGYSLFQRSVVMLRVALLTYCVMNVQDIMIGISRTDPGLIIGASVACALSASMIAVLSRKE